MSDMNNLDEIYSLGLVQSCYHSENDVKPDQIRSIHFTKNDKPDGHIQEFYPGKRLKADYYVHEGLRQGPFVEYYPNGTIFIQGSFNNGERDGAWEQYDAEQHLEKQGFYKNGYGVEAVYSFHDGRYKPEVERFVEKGIITKERKITNHYWNANKLLEALHQWQGRGR